MAKFLVRLLFGALRIYTDCVPFARGRGFFIRAIRGLQRLGAPPPRCNLAEGVSIEFESSLVGWTIFETGSWEPIETAVIRSLLRPGHVVINVGANTGYYTIIAASEVGPSGHVYAFEIQTDIAEILRRNVEHNRFGETVTIIGAGCYSAEGTAFLHAKGDPGAARIAFSGNGTQVPLTTLDRFATIHDLQRLDLIVIDTEGADFEVLKGGENVLRRFRPAVIVELDHLATFGATEDQLLAFMLGLSYRSRTIGTQFSRDVLFTPSECRDDRR